LKETKKPFVFDAFFLNQRTFYCLASDLKSALGMFLIKTIIKTRLGRPSQQREMQTKDNWVQRGQI